MFYLSEAVEAAPFFDTEVWIILTNLALVIATAVAIIQAVKEGHRHEEEVAREHDVEDERLAKIVDKVLEHEHQHENETTNTEQETK